MYDSEHTRKYSTDNIAIIPREEFYTPTRAKSLSQNSDIGSFRLMLDIGTLEIESKKNKHPVAIESLIHASKGIDYSEKIGCLEDLKTFFDNLDLHGRRALAVQSKENPDQWEQFNPRIKPIYRNTFLHYITDSNERDAIPAWEFTKTYLGQLLDKSEKLMPEHELLIKNLRDVMGLEQEKGRGK